MPLHNFNECTVHYHNADALMRALLLISIPSQKSWLNPFRYNYLPLTTTIYGDIAAWVCKSNHLDVSQPLVFEQIPEFSPYESILLVLISDRAALNWYIVEDQQRPTNLQPSHNVKKSSSRRWTLVKTRLKCNLSVHWRIGETGIFMKLTPIIATSKL